MKFNIIDEDEMISTIEEFYKEGSRKVLYVGGMVGSEIFKFVTDVGIQYYSYAKTLYLEGCQDYISMSKYRSPNHLFYPSILEEVYQDRANSEYDPFKAKWVNPKPEICTVISLRCLSGFNHMIINNAHLIDPLLLNDIIKAFDGKIVVITDPFDIGGDIYSCYPCIVESFMKLPVSQSFARRIYGFETRHMDLSIPSACKEVKMPMRDVGKIDENQYISNDPEMISYGRKKYYKTGFRKNQRLIVAPHNNRRVYRTFDYNNTNHVLYTNSMITVHVSQEKPFMTFKIYMSKDNIKACPTYDYDELSYRINVEPASVISLNQGAHHRYKNIVLVLNKEIPITTAEKYSMFKNSMNVKVLNRKGINF